jgi:hypothetical protein
LFSDDSPLIDREGHVMAFPLRLGFERDVSEVETYTLKRKQYGTKYLVSIDQLGDRIARNYNKTFLFQGKRYSKKGCFIKRQGKWPLMLTLLSQCVIGFGLPILVEYFWERGKKDFWRKTKIFFSRLTASFHLVMTSDCYQILLGSDIELNRKVLIKFLDERKNAGH